jgi:hypothetical protein
MKNLLAYMSSKPKAGLTGMVNDLKGIRQTEWVNLGGQLMLRDDVDKLRSDIGTSKLKSWNDIHARYNELWLKYNTDKQKHAFAVLCEISGEESLSPTIWRSALDKAIIIQKYVCDQVYSSRKKDFDNPYRQTTFRNKDEMKAAFGTVDENSFIVQVRKETEEFEVLVEEIKKRSAL